MTTFTLFLTAFIILIIATLLIYFLMRPTYRTVANGPSILTSIGIFGTFLGIAIGLAFFQPLEIHQAVPEFLAGIKLAFWSSVAGILAALIHKFKFILYPYSEEGEQDERDILKRMIGALQGVRNSFEKQELLITKQLENSRLLSMQSRESFSDDVDRLAQVLKSSNVDISDKADQQFSKTTQMLDEVSDKLGSIVAGIISASTSSNQNFENVVGKLDDVGNQFVETINKSNDALEQQATMLAEQLGSRHESAIQKMSGDMAEKIVDGSGSSIAQVASRMDDIGDRLESAIQKMSSDLADKMVDESAIQKMSGDMAEKIVDGSGSSIAQVASRMDDIGDRLESAMQMMTQAITESSSGQLQGVMGGFDELIEKLVDQNKEANDMTAKLISNMEADSAKEREASRKSMEKISNELSNVVDAGNVKISEALGGLSDINEASLGKIEALIDRQVKTTDAYRKAREKLEHDLSTRTKKLDETFGQLLDTNKSMLDADLKAMEQQMADKAERDDKLVELISGSQEASTKAMLRMLKEILDATQGHNREIAVELVKLRHDVSAEYKATSEYSDALMKQLRAMSEAYKSAVLASAAELKAQMAQDMKENHMMIEKYQLAALDRLEGIAGIMENVVSSSSEMGELMHENSISMKNMQNAFVGTNEGSFGRFMLDMNEKVLSQLKRLEGSFTVQGNMGKLMQDLNEETTKQLRIMERAFDNAAGQIKKIPAQITKAVGKK